MAADTQRPTEPAIQVEHLTKVFRDFWGRARVTAVSDLSLTVRRGEIFGLLGPNGSGKTTTLKLLMGLLFPTSGTATVLGRPATDVRVKERIGFLAEESYLYRFLNAEETLDFYGRLFRLPRAERRRRTERLIEEVKLTDARKRPLREYSKGMTRRIGLAQALINDPDVIFLDEPTSGLDPIGSAQVKDLILKLKSEGKTVFLCSHLLADVENVCDRIAMLVSGKLGTMGDVRDLLSIKDCVQMTVRDLSDEDIETVRATIEQSGGTVEEIGRPYESLESLFLRVIADTRRSANDGAGEPSPKADR